MEAIVNCQQCKREMKQGKRVDKNIALQLLGLIIFLFGVALLFAFPFGTIIGVVLMIGALPLGYRKRKIWKCPSCGYFFDRA